MPEVEEARDWEWCGRARALVFCLIFTVVGGCTVIGLIFGWFKATAAWNPRSSDDDAVELFIILLFSLYSYATAIIIVNITICWATITLSTLDLCLCTPYGKIEERPEVRSDGTEKRREGIKEDVEEDMNRV